MSKTKFDMPFPDKQGFKSSELNVDMIKEHLLDWLIGCYDGGETICNLLPSYMHDIEDIFSEQENDNLEQTKKYLKLALRELRNTRIDEAVQKRTEPDPNDKNRKKLNLNINFEDEALKGWTFKDINTPKPEFTGVRGHSSEKLLERTMDFRIDKNKWEEMEYENSSPKFKEGIFSYTAQAKPTHKDFLESELEKMQPNLEIEWGNTNRGPTTLTSITFNNRKKFEKTIKDELNEEENEAKQLEIFKKHFKGVEWFLNLKDKFWTSEIGTVSNADYLLNPFIISEYDIKIEFKNNKLGKITIIAIPQKEAVIQQKGQKNPFNIHTRGETKREPTMEEVLTPRKKQKPQLDLTGQEQLSRGKGESKADEMQTKHDLWKHLKSNMITLERYIKEATA